jgi:type III pantothenate kinase
MILAIDAGNTRIKWGLHDGQTWLFQGQHPHHEIDQFEHALDQLPMPQQIVLSNVAGAQLQDRLEHSLGRYSVRIQYVSARVSQCGVRNAYITPEQLGADRWAALIGAHRLGVCTGLVINAGTAITLDALHQGDFLGGIILPGYHMMGSMLVQGTAGLTHAPGKLSAWPDNTADALETGRILAITGAVALMHEQLQRHSGDMPELMVSGGNGAQLAIHLSQPVRLVENLVLEGLRTIASEECL